MTFYRPSNPGVSNRSGPKGRGNETNPKRLALLEEDKKNRKEFMDKMQQIDKRKLCFVGAVMSCHVMLIDVLPVTAYVIRQDLLYSNKADCIMHMVPSFKLSPQADNSEHFCPKHLNCCWLGFDSWRHSHLPKRETETEIYIYIYLFIFMFGCRASR